MSTIYENAAQLLEDVVVNGKSIKTAFNRIIGGYERRNGDDKGATSKGKVDRTLKASYALASETLKHYKTIEEIIQRTSVLNDMDFKKNDRFVMKLMIFDLLFGSKKISGSGNVKKAVLEHRDALLSQKEQLIGSNNEYSVMNESMTEALNFPFYLRINNAKITHEEAISYIQNIIPEAKEDDIIPNLLQIPAKYKSTITRDENTKSGKFIIQDKPSCFPAQVLIDEYMDINNRNGNSNYGDVIDACAAPGNKTSHLAALLVDNDIDNKVFAFDRDPKRCQILRTRMHNFGFIENAFNRASNPQDKIVVANEDFLRVDIHKFRNVRALLLDPSCSGSGIIRDISRHVKTDNNDSDAERDNNNEEKDNERLHQLAAFQSIVIKKAMGFTSAQVIVYSTCSTHQQENEEVVLKALEHSQEKYGGAWKLKSPKILSSWQSRGKVIDGLDSTESEKLVRCSSDQGMNGFFVALFVREELPEIPNDEVRAVKVKPAFLMKRSRNQASGEDTKEDNNDDNKRRKTSNNNNNNNSGASNNGGSLFSKKGKFVVSNTHKRKYRTT